jgi:hypothetical protein
MLIMLLPVLPFWRVPVVSTALFVFMGGRMIPGMARCLRMHGTSHPSA